MDLFDHQPAPQPLPETFARWFAARGWSPRARINSRCSTRRARRSALLIAPTDAGKTLAGFLPTLVELSGVTNKSKIVSTGRGVTRSEGLHTLYISPLKALAVDIAGNLEAPIAEMNLPVRVDLLGQNREAAVVKLIFD